MRERGKMADEQMGSTGSNGDPSTDRPYTCGALPGACSWPQCDDGVGCSFGDGSFTGVQGDADSGSGKPTEDSRVGFEEPRA